MCVAKIVIKILKVTELLLLHSKRRKEGKSYTGLCSLEAHKISYVFGCTSCFLVVHLTLSFTKRLFTCECLTVCQVDECCFLC